MASVTPLRPGPSDPDAAARIRERILDAATDCLLAEGLDARLHAMIAERAGISRPTVYKYVGDQAAIVAAILDRELDQFFGAAVPLLRRSDDLEAHLVDAIVFVVEYGRGHALLQKALREHPELILPALTTESGALVERVVTLFEDQLGRALSQAASTGSAGSAGTSDDALTPRAAAEWGYRIVISLITTPTPALDEEGTRPYVANLVRLMRIAG
ncbi:TetR/AcrR family transcriptional regulator [Nocardioides bizhenqiangii]|uniref:TetR/AcrR family transcriptional regulator n=1 Tax=Nocardioides bizhenqiangii TaxID=3095076 RepID=A0ABZ0ZT09_9ACTN|nr:MULTISPECIES: TetR/AcrR family transcriptional regulator [unclassified Nocardioides]MDZ5622789.1 TetR/AcrR family transcriptional regulator [Nocardioides sp. HM23]WQQ27051.1 TetR/AcrR family transcriptional regulator [Nocardioides sp. HM61]